MYFFDLHCDTLTKAKRAGVGLVNTGLQLSLDRLSGVGWTQCFAIVLSDTLRGTAAQYYDAHVCYFAAQMQTHADRVISCRTAAEIAAANACGKIAAVLTVESGAALAGELERIETLRRDGVRMLTLTWNDANELAGGTAASPLSQYLTPFGEQALAALERAGIVADVSHLSDVAFRQLARLAKRPFVASHSNLRSVCDHPRNLTDDQFRQIAGTGGLVGLNFYPRFVGGRENGSFDDLSRHLERMLTLGGEETVALGSDFDGADMPAWLSSAAAIPELHTRWCERFGAELCDKLFSRNACRFFTTYDGESKGNRKTGGLA